MIKTVLTSIVMGLVPITVFSQNTIPGYTINSSTEASTVSTEYGKVAGYIENGIYNYKGIPYAEAERFEEPHAPATWNGIRSSRYYGPTCPRRCAPCGEWTMWLFPHSGMTDFPEKTACG